MTLENWNAISKALDVPSLQGLPEEKYPELVALLPDIPDELRLKLFELIPGFLQFALDAMKAVEETLQTTIKSNDKNQAELNESFGDLRNILKGRLERDGISEEHERFLIENLMNLQNIQVDKDSENKRFLSDQANATRLSKMAHAAMPVLETVIMTGVRIMISRGRV